MVAKRSTAVTPEAIGAVRCDKPQSGKEYLESLQDGREVYIYGDRVDDVTTHPAFRNTTRMTARLFDALHDEEKSKKIVSPVDAEVGRGGDRRSRRDRGMAAHHVWLARPIARLQSLFPGDAGR